MQKIFLTSIITTAIILPAAGEIYNGAACNQTNLQTTTGSADIEAHFSPNHINLRFYDGIVPQNAPAGYDPFDPNRPADNMCTYDMLLPLTPAPIRPGYEFKGWTLYNPLRHIDIRSFPVNETNYQTAMQSNQSVDSDLNVPQPVHWKVTNTMSGKTIYGQVRCSLVSAPIYSCKLGMTYCNREDESNRASDPTWHPELPLADNVKYWRASDKELDEWDEYIRNDPSYDPQNTKYYCWCKPVTYRDESLSMDRQYKKIKNTDLIARIDNPIAPMYWSDESMCISECASYCTNVYTTPNSTEDIEPLTKYRIMMYYYQDDNLPQTEQQLMDENNEYMQSHYPVPGI